MTTTSTETTAPGILAATPLDADLAITVRRRVRARRAEREALAAELPALEKMDGRDVRLALAHWALGHAADAERHAHAAGADPLAHYVLGALARAEGREDAALAYFEKSAALAPTSAPCALAPVESLLRLGRYDDAIAYIEKHRRDFSDKAQLAFLEGRARSRMGEHESALACYHEAMRLDPEHGPSIFHAASLLDLRGNDEEAKKLYERIGPDHPALYVNACLNLGLIYDDEGDAQNAIRCFRHVLQSDHNNARAKLFLVDAEATLTMFYSPEESKQSERLDAILRIPVSDFELSVRSRNCLTTMNIQTLGDLVKKTESEMLAYKNFGETSLREIKEMLSSKGLRLGLMREDAATRAAMERQRRNVNQEILSKSLDELELGVRARKCCEAQGLATIGDLVSKSEMELAGARNFGRVSMNEIKKKLADIGLSLRDAKEGEEADYGDDDEEGFGLEGDGLLGGLLRGVAEDDEEEDDDVDVFQDFEKLDD